MTMTTAITATTGDYDLLPVHDDADMLSV